MFQLRVCVLWQWWTLSHVVDSPENGVYVRFRLVLASFRLFSTGMDQFNPSSQELEQEYFNWKCVVCAVVAYSPLVLEEQHMLMEMSVYTDIDGQKWVKCDDCEYPFHLKCATSDAEIVVASKRFICTFFGCRK